MSQRKPVVGSSFVCGNIGAQFFIQDEGVVAELALTAAQEGPPGCVHGGALASILDEAMGIAAWNTGRQAVAVELTFTYKQPVPLGVTVQVSAEVQSSEGRKVFTAGRIALPDGRVAVESKGIFVEAPHLFENDQRGGFRFGEAQ